MCFFVNFVWQVWQSWTSLRKSISDSIKGKETRIKLIGECTEVSSLKQVCVLQVSSYLSEVRISARGQGRIYWGLVSWTNFIVGGKRKGNKLKRCLLWIENWDNGVFTNKMNNRLALLCWKTMLWPCSSRATIFDREKIVLCERFFPNLIARFLFFFFFTGPNFGYKSIKTYWQVSESFSFG